MLRIFAALLLALAGAVPAWAQERDYCPTRPGLGETPCTIDLGRRSLELGVIDWERDRDADEVVNTVLAGDALFRVGVGYRTELSLGWTAYGHQRTRDRASGSVETVEGVGDVTLGLRQNLRSPDGSDLSVAVLPTVTLPVGARGIGAGDWGAALDGAISYDLTPTLNLQATPGVAAAVDEDGDGRHLAYHAVIGLGIDLGAGLTLVTETEVERDDDPARATTHWLGAVSLAWASGGNLQLDAGLVAGLNHDTPDLRLSAGVSRLF